MTEYNLRVLQEAAALARTLGGPWVMPGDWNVQPDMVRETNWLKVAKGTVVTTELTTCNDHTYDLFVVSHCLAHTVAGVQRLDDAGMSFRAPCRLLLRGDGRRHASRQLHRAPRVPAALPHGPATKPPSYEKVMNTSDTKAGVTAAMVEWYNLAREEWTTLAGSKLQFRGFGLK